MFSRVSAEVLSANARVVSTFKENCRAAFACFPYTYCTKDESSHLVIDYFLSCGGVETSRGSVDLIMPLLLFKLNDHFPIIVFFQFLPLQSTRVFAPAALFLMMSSVLAILFVMSCSLVPFSAPPLFP